MTISAFNQGLYITNAVLFGILTALFLCMLVAGVILGQRRRLRQKRSTSASSESATPTTTAEARDEKQRKRLVLLHGITLCFLNCIFSISVVNEVGSWTRGDGAVVNVVRWLVYTVSCSFLAASIAECLRHSKLWFWVAVSLVGSTLFCGFLVTIESSEAGRLLLYLGGFVPFLLALAVVVWKSRVHANWAFWVLLAYLVSWAVYPVAFALGPAMYAQISANQEATAYAITDWVSKMAFSVFVVLTVGSSFVPSKRNRQQQQQQQQWQPLAEDEPEIEAVPQKRSAGTSTPQIKVL